MEKIFFGSIPAMFIGIALMAEVIPIDNVWLPRSGLVIFAISLFILIVVSMVYKCRKIGYIIGISLWLFIISLYIGLIYSNVEWIPYNSIVHMLVFIVAGISVLVSVISSFLYQFIYKYK